MMGADGTEIWSTEHSAHMITQVRATQLLCAKSSLTNWIDRTNLLLLLLLQQNYVATANIMITN